MLILVFVLIFITNTDSYYNACIKRSIISMTINSGSSSDDNSVIFGGVKFAPPLSNHLRRLGIKSALPIQESAIR